MEVALRHTPSFGVARVKLGPNEPVKVESGAMYAMSAGVELESKMEGGFLKSAKRAMLGGDDTRWGGFKNMFGAEGGFILRAAGAGRLVMSCYGALETWDLQPGQTLTVDTGHMVSYEESVQMSLRKVTGGLVQSFKSGEGLVFDFVGPGRVTTQTRNPNELLGWISSFIGTGNASGAGPGGMLGGVFGRD
jgi:uncharacterized protein (AIM24 family)